MGRIARDKRMANAQLKDVDYHRLQLAAAKSDQSMSEIIRRGTKLIVDQILDGGQEDSDDDAR